jgi:hypothetical protein
MMMGALSTDQAAWFNAGQLLAYLDIMLCPSMTGLAGEVSCEHDTAGDFFRFRWRVIRRGVHHNIIEGIGQESLGCMTDLREKARSIAGRLEHLMMGELRDKSPDRQSNSLEPSGIVVAETMFQPVQAYRVFCFRWTCVKCDHVNRIDDCEPGQNVPCIACCACHKIKAIIYDNGAVVVPPNEQNSG